MDTKKLVVAFLILSILASSAAFLLIQPGGGAPAPVATVAQPVAPVESGVADAAAFYAGNAFAPSSTVALENTAGVIVTAAPAADNLTDQILAAYVGNININDVSASGTLLSASDTLTANIPSEDSLLTAINQSPLIKNVQIPNWDAQAAAQPIIVATDSSPSALANYGSALENMYNQYVVKQNVMGFMDNPNGPDIGGLTETATNLAAAVKDLTAQPVPASLVNFQKSLVRVTTYGENAVALMAVAQADPVKVYAISQAEQKGMNDAIQSFQNEWLKAEGNASFSAAIQRASVGHANPITAFVAGIIGVHTAYAQYTDIPAFAQRLFAFVQYFLGQLQSIVLQTLVNLIVSKLQSAVFNLIRNSGNPLFIRAFGPFLQSAFNVAAGSALGEIFPTLCGNFSTDVSGWLKSAFTNAAITPGGVALNGSPGTNCTLQTVVPNIAKFTGNFNAYGFRGYAALLQPQNNPYGAFLEAYNSVIVNAAGNTTAANTKAVASQGFVGQTTCPNGAATTGSACQGGALEPIIRTPGKSLSDLLSKRLGADQELSASAKNIAGVLATAVANIIMGAIQKSGIF